jgi:hypothetical protein
MRDGSFREFVFAPTNNRKNPTEIGFSGAFNRNGEEGIRTPGTLPGSSDFKSDAIDQLCHLSQLDNHFKLSKPHINSTRQKDEADGVRNFLE